MTRIDVGVVTWNTAEMTTKALRHLLEVNPHEDLRILVRDNGSTDGTPEAIAAAIPEAEIDAGTDNLGFAAGMNTLLARSDAEWFLCLNSDAWPEPGAIAAMRAAGAAHPRAAAIAPRLERPDGTLEHSTHPFPSPAIAAVMAVGGDRWLPRRLGDRLLLEPAWDHRRARTVDWAVGAALLMRRTAVDEIGGFDERFFMYAEDLAWGHRAHELGWTTRFEPAAVVVHVGNASGQHRYGTRRTRTYLENTHRWYLDTHGPTRSALYRAVNAAGAWRAERAARRGGDEGAAEFWREIRRVHRAPVPTHDTSRPEGA